MCCGVLQQEAAGGRGEDGEGMKVQGGNACVVVRLNALIASSSPQGFHPIEREGNCAQV